MLWVQEGGNTTPGEGSSGFTAGQVLIADAAGAINDGPPASNYTLVPGVALGDIRIRPSLDASGVGSIFVIVPYAPAALGAAGYDVELDGGAGAAGTGATPGGAGGLGQLYGGFGGAGVAGAAAGRGGDVYITSGPGGTNNGGGGARGGDVFIDGSEGTGGQRSGDVLLGTVTVGVWGTGFIYFGVDFLPNATGTLDIGSTGNKVKDIHLGGDAYVGDDVVLLLGVAHDVGVATSTAATIVGGALNVFAGTGAVAQGASPGAVGGALTLTGGVGGAGITGVSPGNGGALALAGGAGGARVNSGASSGGSVTINGGAAAGVGAGTGGSITLTSGNGGATGAAGDIVLQTGSADGILGSISLTAADVTLDGSSIVSDTLSVGTGAAATGTLVFQVGGSVSPTAGADGYLAQFGGTLVEAASGAHAVMAGAAFLAPTLTTTGAATTTVLANAYVAANPTGGGINCGLLADGRIILGNDVAICSRNQVNGVTSDLLKITTTNYFDIGNGGGALNGLRIYSCGSGSVSFPDANVLFSSAVEIDGAFNHDGTTFGALGKAPAAQVAFVADGTDAATTQTLANALKAQSIAHGFMAAS